MHAEYVTSAYHRDQLQDFGLPEVALVGRSNSGKSTLINALTGRKSLARTGRTPGQTPAINFYRVDERMILADLPGYGFSITAKRVRRDWQEMIAAYLERPSLRLTFFLMDVRRTPDDDDLHLLDWLGRNSRVVFVQTKVDKLSQSQAATRRRALTAFLDEAQVSPDAFCQVSGMRRRGLAHLESAIATALGAESAPINR